MFGKAAGRLFAITVLVTLAGSAPACAGEAHSLSAHCQEEVGHWARSHAVSETDSKAYFKQLSQLMGGSQVVALGSPVEGTVEFIQTRRTILQYLIEQQAFNLFGIEAGFAECERVNQYVSDGKGDINALLLNLQSCSWSTEEMAETLRWLRDYNSAQPQEHRVRFFGFDSGDPRMALPVVHAYLERVHSPLLAMQQQLELAYSLFEEYSRGASHTGSDYPQRAGIIVQRVDELIARLQREQQECVAQSSPAEFESVLLHLQHVKRALQWSVISAQENAPIHGVRDRWMSQDIERALKQRGAGRAVIWTHDEHVCKATHDDSGFTLGDRSLGSYLAELHRERFVAVGGLFGQGSFLGIAASKTPGPPQTISLGSAPDGYLELSFAAVRKPPVLVDTRQLPANSQAAFCLLHDTFMRTAQSNWSRTSTGATPVRKDDYDALLYVDAIKAAKPL